MRRPLLLASIVLASPALLLLAAQTGDRSPHGFLAADCGECHSAERWVPLARVRAFRHEATGFPLEGTHARVDCAACHRSLVFNRVAIACADCHADPHKGELGSRCEACHKPSSWSNQTELLRVHSRTRFPLFAAHARVDCEACHRGQRPFEYATTPTECGRCHARTYAETRDPNHAAAGFPMECQGCHGVNASSWRGVSFRHDSFVLRGVHLTTRCAACHTSGYAGTPRECVGCHRADFDRTREPDHRAAGFPDDCSGCHRETGWRPASNVDHERTRFPLRGAHQAAACSQCHVASRFAGTPTQCAGCHAADRQAAQNPVHSGANFDQDCEACHSVSGWRPATLDHNQTRFPLTGAHRGADCASCHKNGAYAGTPQDCVACHEADFGSAREPNHVAGGFSRQCKDCHTTTTWRPAGFDHDQTGFVLEGGHARASCESCHKGGRYAGTPRECVACHEDRYRSAANPNHVAGNFSQQCQDCHTTRAWRPASFDHNTTRFRLTGAHARTDCAACHPGGRYAGTPTDCYACHRSNYDGTTNPNHRTSNFSTDCTGCHNTNAWRPATFDHNATRFRLTGAHARTDCAACHPGGRYAGTPTDCYACHRSNYDGTTNPNHRANNFPTDCTSCHTTNAWRPATFDHNQTRFRLTGAHTRVDCASCHPGGRYAGTPTDCYACHRSNYDGTTNPNHRNAGFPTSCTDCHTTNAWRPATFDHDGRYFPIYSGKHRGKWSQCTDCHVTPGNYRVFECIQCHEHSDRRKVDDKHKEVAGYRYDSRSCYQCHPRGTK